MTKRPGSPICPLRHLTVPTCALEASSVRSPRPCCTALTALPRALQPGFQVGISSFRHASSKCCRAAGLSSGPRGPAHTRSPAAAADSDGTPSNMETAVNDLEIACLTGIFSLLSADDCGRAACVHPLWNSVLGEDVLWRPHLASDFAAGAAVRPDETATPSFRAAYSAWRTAYADVAGPLLSRTLACWNSIKAWLATNSPQVLETLNPGATAEELAAAEQQLGHPLPPAVRCIYRVHNGQDLQLDGPAAGDEDDDSEEADAPNRPPPRLLLGLFGSLVFYEHITSNALQSLSNVVKHTLLLRSARPMGARNPHLPSRHVVIACSFRIVDKLCVCDCDSGGAYLKTSPGRDWALAPAADSSPGARDGMLRWMEEYAARLAGGWYGGLEGDSALAGSSVRLAGAISLFPRCFPVAATAITRGVQVSWSSVLVPQECRQNRLMFAYNVRYSLLTPAEEAAALRRLANEQRQWQQRLQDAGAGETSAAAAAHGAAAAAAAAAAAGPHRGLGRPPADLSNSKKQAVAIGPCDAAAGPASVPEALGTTPTWAAAAAAAAAGAAAAHGGGSSGGGTSPSAAPAGAADDATGAAASSAAISSCQLETRNWSILDASGSVIDRVSGEGVVGLYPLLVPGGDAFAYASCTPVAVDMEAARAGGGGGGSEAGHGGSSSLMWPGGQLAGSVVGAMEGSFSFVEGSLMQRAGPGMTVVCSRIVFAVPEFIF